MPRVPQMFEACSALSQLLWRAGIAHAYHGGFLAFLLGAPRDTEDLFCIVSCGFRTAREAVAGSESFTTAFSTWSNRLFITYTEPIPSIEIEIVLAGERGPRRLDRSTITVMRQIPFLSITEFLRAKVRVWAISGDQSDAADIIFCLSRYWESIDINRIPEVDMDRFVTTYAQAAQPWDALRARYED